MQVSALLLAALVALCAGHGASAQSFYAELNGENQVGL